MNTYDVKYAKSLRDSGKYEELFAYCMENEDNPEAMSDLSVCYFYGHGTAQNYNQCFFYDNKAAQLGSARGKVGLAYDYLCGVGTEKNYDLALDLLKQSAAEDYPSAYRYLGICYEDALGVDRNETKAVELYTKAAELEDRIATRKLALCYERGTGVDKDVVKASELYEKAADLGDSIAKRHLGVCYENGIGVKVNLEKAVALYAQASSAGDATATRYLALCYDDGTGVAQCADKAADLYQLAIAQGDEVSAYYLAFCYEHGTGVEKNTKKAAELYCQAANCGYVVAYYKLGNCYKDGIGVEANAEKAIQCFKTCSEHSRTFEESEFADLWQKLAECYEVIEDTDAAEKAYQKAMSLYSALTDTDNGYANYCIGKIRQWGCQSVRDRTKAFQHFESAYLRDYGKAAYELAWCYEYGYGVPCDKKKAFALINNAAEKYGYLYELLLGVYFEYGIGTKRNPKSAVAIYQKHIDDEKEDLASISRFLLGVCYYHGEGVGRDMDKALKLFQRSNEVLSKFYKQIIVDPQKSDFSVLSLAYRVFPSGQGWWVKQNLPRSYEFCLQAYNRYPTSFNEQLADLCFEGNGTKRDLKKAFDLYAKSDSDTARQYVGCFYYYGETIPRNGDSAVKTFDYGARKNNDSGAEVYLGLCYLNGVGVRKSIDEALKWFSLASKQDNGFGTYGAILWSLIDLSQMSKSQTPTHNALTRLEIVADKNPFASEIYRLYQQKPTRKTAKTLLELVQIKLSIPYCSTTRKIRIFFKSLFLGAKLTIRKKGSLLRDLMLLQAALSKAEADIAHKDILLSEKDYFISLLTQEVTYYRDVIETKVDEVNARTAEMQEQIKTIIGKLDVDIQQQKSTLFSANDMIQLSDEEVKALEAQRTNFINNMAEKISERLYKKGATEVDVEEKQLKGMFGVYWDDLDEYTKKSLVSAKVFLSNCSNASYSNLDYSGVAISATSALENELKIRFHTGYQQYLRNCFQDNYDNWPESMKFRLKTGRYVEEREFTLGSMPYIFGGRIRKEPSVSEGVKRRWVSISDQDRSVLNDYLQSILVDNQYDSGIFLTEQNGVSFIDRCEDVRCLYRNKAAHTDTLSIETARDCCRDIIEVVDQNEAAHNIGQIQGLIYDLVRLTRHP